MADLPEKIGEATFGGVVLPEYRLTPDFLFCRSVFLFGGTNTGKTTFGQMILQTLIGTNKFERGVLINPTRNPDYMHLFPEPFVHVTVDKELIQRIVDQQKYLSELYKAASDPANMQACFDRHCRDDGRTHSMLKRLSLETASSIRSCRQSDCDERQKNALIKRFETTSQEMRLELIKLALMRAWREHPEDFDAEDSMLCEGLSFSPYFLLLFDDAAAQMQKFWKTQLFSDMIFNLRHYGISLVFMSQAAANCVDKNIRQNSHISFFTDAKNLISFFANGGSKAEQKIVQAICDSKFFDRGPNLEGPYRILLYSKGNFGYVISKRVQCQSFGGALYREFAATLEKTGGTRFERLARKAEGLR